jgi:F0F1-type ATP synthase assembly protein I
MINDPEQKSAGKPRKRSEFARYLGIASTVGINLVACSITGFVIGYFFLDRYVFQELLSFNTFPWFTIIFSILGIVAGFKYLFRIASKLRQEDNGNP